MPTFEQCANCGELRVEHYGAVTEDKCVYCAAIERRGISKARAAFSTSPQQEEPTGNADISDTEARRHIRIMTLISGHIDSDDGPYEFSMLDISKSGAKLRTAHRPANDTLTLTFPNIGTLHANLAWRQGDIAGVSFVEPPEEVIAMIGQVSPPLEPVLRAA